MSHGKWHNFCCRAPFSPRLGWRFEEIVVETPFKSRRKRRSTAKVVPFSVRPLCLCACAFVVVACISPAVCCVLTPCPYLLAACCLPACFCSPCQSPSTQSPLKKKLRASHHSESDSDDSELDLTGSGAGGSKSPKVRGDDASKASHTRVGITKFKFVAVCLVLVDSHASSAG